MNNSYNKKLLFPKKLFDKTFGFTMDFGGSAIKIIYTTEEGDNICFNFAIYPRDKHEEAFAMLEEKCSGKLEPGTEVFTCGLGASEYNQELTKRFNLKFTVTDEFQRLVEGFCFMYKNLPWTDFVQPISASAMAYGQNQAEQMQAMLTYMASAPESTCKPMKFTELEKVKAKKSEEDTDNIVQYPTIFVLAGSAAGVVKMESDGSYVFLEDISSAGRTFLALGSLLTDTGDFDDLCDLAKKGTPSKVDVYCSNLEVDPDDFYGSAVEHGGEVKAFSFGHGVGKKKEDFNKEDIAASLVSLIVDPIIKSAYTWASHYKVKQVFMLGGFPCNNSLIQEEFSRHFACKRFYNNEDHTCDIYFLKLGAHCGSFGAVLKNLGLSCGDTNS